MTANRRVFEELRTSVGLSGRDIAKILGVSEQRVSQIATAVAGTGRDAKSKSRSTREIASRVEVSKSSTKSKLAKIAEDTAAKKSAKAERIVSGR